MTRTTNARIIGFTFLFYIAAGIANMVLFNRATSGEGTSAKLANIVQHTSALGVSLVLDLLCCLSAVVLAVSLYAVTRDEDRDLAMLGLACRLGEGVIGAANLPKTLGLLWLATAGAGAGGPDAATAEALGAFLLIPAGSSGISAVFFAVGSTLFSYLLLRGRMIPIALARLGVFASALLVLWLPLQLAGFLNENWYVWMPMLVFEITLAVWLLTKGLASPSAR
jgi:hypothetical protein